MENDTSVKTNIKQGKHYRITVLSEILLRLEYSESGVFLDEQTEFAKNRIFPMPKFASQEDDKYLVIETDYFRLEYVKEKSFVGTKFVPEQNLKVLLKDTDKYWYVGHVEARNFKSIGVSIDGVDNITYSNKGLYSTDGFVSIDDSNSLIVKDNTFYKRPNKELDIYLFMYKRNFGLVYRDYFILTNKPYMIPRYMFGNIWNKDVYYTQDNVISLIQKFNKKNIPINAIILGNGWHSKNDYIHGLSWNTELFVDYNSFINYLKEKNVYLGVTINPVVVSKLEKGFQEFSKLINADPEKDVELNPYDKNMMDAYLKVFIEPLYNNGVSNLLIDYNTKNINTLRAFNSIHSEYFKEKGLKNPIISRNGLIGTHAINTIYTGRTIVSWSVLNDIPEYIISACNNGLSYISTDIGGFYGGIEDDELYRRYVEFGTFSPILRLSSEGSHYYKREPWMWDLNTLNVVKYYLRLRAMLIPYLYSESYYYSETGIPMIRPVYYSYPEIYDEPEYKNEYYFGKSLFVSPITKQKDEVMNRTIQRVFLPKGIWYDFKTGIKYTGNKRYITFYKDEDYPVFATQGSIIPLAVLNEDDLNNTKNPDNFEIHIFPGKSNSYMIYEDDGITISNDKYVKTIIDYNYMSNNYTVIIKEEVKDSSLIPSVRTFTIRFRNTRNPNEVTVYLGEDKLEEFEHYVDENDFIVKIPNANSFKQITINCKGQDIEIDNVRIINKDIDDIINDLKIKTILKNEVSKIMFSEEEIKSKRLSIRKLKRKGLHPRYITMFLKLLEYIEENI